MDEPNEKPIATAPQGEIERADVTGEAHITDTEVDAESRHLKWFEEVYQGDHVPQLTLRAVLMGGVLGSLMSISNLYTMLKLGWGFAVAITACVLSYCIWNSMRFLFRGKLTPMSILENNCMQSTASAAGYSTGSTIATAFGAHLLITGHQVPWQILAPWTLITALLGVFLAVPMKRQMINQEQLAFPTGIAAAATLKSLYSESREAVLQAYALVSALAVGAVVGLLRTGEFAWQMALKLKLPELVPFNYVVKGGALPGLGFEPSVMLISAGMIVGLRVSISMFIGSCILYFIVAPMMLQSGDIEAPAKLLKWALWTGTALMVTSGLTAFGLQWKTIARSFTALGGAKNDKLASEMAAADAIEVPMKWCMVGVIPLAIIMAILEYVAFSISIPLGLLSVATSFILGLVACRSTGETDVTPIGAMGKITQLVYAALSPGNIVTNLMTASVTANTAIASADLLTDLKSGYILGANPRKQFWAQLIGVFFGTVAIVPAWYLMIPTKEILESYNPPNTNLWRAVAEALSVGIQAVPVSARYGLLIGGVLGIILAALEHFFPKARKYLPSAMGLGLSWIMVFANSLSFLLGAIIAAVWTKVHKKSGDAYIIPIASGAIAGESLICAMIAMLAAYAALAHH